VTWKGDLETLLIDATEKATVKGDLEKLLNKVTLKIDLER
jgi:hypothetical protein